MGRREAYRHLPPEVINQDGNDPIVFTDADIFKNILPKLSPAQQELLTSILSARPREAAATSRRASYMDTINETVDLVGLEIVSRQVLSLAGIRSGNASVDHEVVESFLQKPDRAFFILGVVGPVIEEGIYRLAPSVSIDAITHRRKRGFLFWQVGVVDAAVFALTHNVVAQDREAARSMIPLPQFMLGTYLWKVMRERGFSHALLSHAVHNTISFGITYITHRASSLQFKG